MAEEDLLAVRRAKLERLRADGIDPFPHAYPGVTPVAEVHAAHGDLEPGTDTAVSYTHLTLPTKRIV